MFLLHLNKQITGGVGLSMTYFIIAGYMCTPATVFSSIGFIQSEKKYYYREFRNICQQFQIWYNIKFTFKSSLYLSQHIFNEFNLFICLVDGLSALVDTFLSLKLYYLRYILLNMKP